ncbi:MAG: hypothetical protein CSA32_01110 [Desulfobulbus propionicus]|nr:MAG: hypothetical protein CSA32_01110 [Desulfobulbus propionicus]
MRLPAKGVLLRIIIGEALRYDGVPLYEWIVVQARKSGVAGATVYRGMMGYGANSRIKTSSIFRLSEDLPVIVELVDSREVLESFFAEIERVISEGVVTMEELDIQMYRHNKEKM